MHTGWIMSWRKTMDSQVFKNAELFKLWMWCLWRANWKPNWVPIKTGRGETLVEVQRGQFVFGRFTAAAELNMKPASVARRMKKLEKFGNVIIQPSTHYSVITVCNYDDYQSVLTDDEQASDHPTITQVAPNDHPTITEKKVKKEKKEKIRNKPPAKTREGNPFAEAFKTAFDAAHTDAYIWQGGDFPQLAKFTKARPEVTPERFAEVAGRQWPRGEYCSGSSMTIRGVCSGWSTLAAYGGNGNGSPAGPPKVTFGVNSGTVEQWAKHIGTLRSEGGYDAQPAELRDAWESHPAIWPSVTALEKK